ncbi:hypothetical protein CAEBREN_26189 [Caenorhabditis brenneri]|uniref:Uncharacterized protein n=1 Tax=Caenorhabditis brenneri TaxID=135651 RepID=G0MEU6_CAEBE|nr:hypothetical protein CAEBREN_26189 [Caenorhabditis brenneri]
MKNKNIVGDKHSPNTVIDTQPLPTELVDGTSVIFGNANEEELDDFLEKLHQEHAYTCPVLCLAMLFVLATGSTSWYLLSITQTGLQAMFYNMAALRNSIGRKLLIVLSFTLMTISILMMATDENLRYRNEAFIKKLMFCLFFISATIGFILMNMYNIKLAVVFNQEVACNIRREVEEDIDCSDSD